MPTQTEPTDQEILELLTLGDAQAMDVLFRRYFSYLAKAVYRLIPNAATAEDLVQEVFLEVWRKRTQLRVNTSLKAYLRRAAVNRSLNYIRDQRLQIDPREQGLDLQEAAPGALENLESAELKQLIDRTIDQLPERCRLIFCLSRFEDLTYQEIADQLDISLKTVENQISKALKVLKKSLDPYLNGGLMTLLSLLLFG